jgi:hypothetical protein
MFFLVIVALISVLPMQHGIAAPPTEKFIQLLYTPGNSSIIIKIIAPNSQITKIEIANLIGRSVRSKPYNNVDDKITMSDLSDLPNGIYLVLAKDKDGKIVDSSKFVLTHQ